MMSVVLVTGSTSGFGRAITVGMLRLGHHVVATVRDRDRGADLVNRCASSGLGVPTIVELDVTDPAARTRAVGETLAVCGRVDVLVNNAGVLDIGPIEDGTDADLERLFAVNVFGPLGLARLVLPHMRSQGGGRIVNITAIGAVLCTPFIGAYVATKHALDAATAALDLEVRPFGVRAVTVLPGSFHTNLAEAATTGSAPGPYHEAASGFRLGLLDRIETAPRDLSPVVQAVIGAGFDPSPEQRTVVADAAMADLLAPSLEQMKLLHRLEAERLGLRPSI